ncbi:SMC-Scp complex subunit ScpB [Candidatus Giovannonibacteria bacterium]|nr:SMC-Scp complex subunit ScpB [Candidatus Giovannonibacteria bacterium]
MSDLSKKIEALLFVAGEGTAISRIATLLKKTDEEIKDAVSSLKEHLESEHFLTILFDGDRVSIVTSPAVSKIVEDFAKEEFAGDLTRAALETLTVIAYKGPIKRSEIDYIRGVNSSFMVRNLLMRGLIERTRDPKDTRSFYYKVSADFLKFLGLSSITDLPEYGALASKLDEFIKSGELKEEPPS